MTTDVKLLPEHMLAAFKDALTGQRGELDAWLEVNNEADVRLHVEAYARANMAELLAENERLRGEVEGLNKVLGPVSAEAIEMRHEAVAQKRRSERLAETLRCARRFLRPEDHDTAYVDAALDQEGGK